MFNLRLIPLPKFGHDLSGLSTRFGVTNKHTSTSRVRCVPASICQPLSNPDHAAMFRYPPMQTN